MEYILLWLIGKRKTEILDNLIKLDEWAEERELPEFEVIP